MNHTRNMKVCAHCGKVFLVSGSCQDYLYKRGNLYYCGYNHWFITTPEKVKSSTRRKPNGK